jgi:hypothetical protein
VVVRTYDISIAVGLVRTNMDKIVEQRNKGEERRHIVLRP